MSQSDAGKDHPAFLDMSNLSSPTGPNQKWLVTAKKHQPEQETLGLALSRLLTTEDTDPLDSVKWVTTDAVIIGGDGKEKFRQDGVEVPAFWQENTINIVAEKYFRVVNGVREHSAKQMFRRVAGWISSEGVRQGYLRGETQVSIFHDELLYLLVQGMYAFNSPVWFNAGAVEKPQCSACFIQSVGDTMESIMDLAKREVMLFKGGSGTGGNLSPLRSSWEKLSGGGWASGPVTFMKGYDAFAGVTKSGGTTRRAAKMQVLNIDHPDVLEQRNGLPGFIRCKSVSEQLAQDLYHTGKYSAEWNKPGNVYDLVGYQNANNSVRVTDEFMHAVKAKGNWATKFKNGTPHKLYRADELFEEISKAAHFCGDPGIQFDTATNKWHTCPKSGRINASNPCQPPWATVLTPEGIRTIADIDVGSTIWSGKQWTKVTRKVFTGHKPVHRFYTRAGIFVGTEEHRVISDGERVQAQAAETIDTAQGPLPLSKVPEDTQAIVDGLVFGDGYVKISNDGRDHYPLLCVGTDDQCYWDEPNIAEYINSVPFDKKSHRVQTTLTKEELPKTYLRRIPERFFNGDEIQTICFLRGLYSANGSVVDKRITLKAASFTVIDQVQQMLSSLGIRSYYTTNKPSDIEFSNGTYTSKESYDLNISTSRADFARLIGFIHPYKQAKLEGILDTNSSRDPKGSYEVVSKALVGVMGVWDIEVGAEEHTYWTGGLLVSNCSEYLFLDETACNLGSLNLMKFAKPGGLFAVDEFLQAVDIVTTAKDIIVEGAGYPTPEIEENSHKFRTLGLGYTNLGALLTYWGLPYDSDEGRRTAATITAIMTGRAYLQSARLAEAMGPFSEYEKNKEDMLRVIEMHKEYADAFPDRGSWATLAKSQWNLALTHGQASGFRNAQVSVLAPTGTISFLMGADTTSIEPMLGCITYKKVVGEGFLVMPNRVIGPALENLGYSDEDRDAILAHISEHGVIYSAPELKKKHGPVFAEALGPHALRPEAHVLMMAAVQPFLSGGISKTVNMPKEATVKDVANIYQMAWELGIKCIAIYRDGCKITQPIGVDKTADKDQRLVLRWGDRLKLPDTRPAKSHKFTVSGVDGYITAGEYPDGSLGECFLKISKQGSTLSGLVDTFAVMLSIGLQYGVPLSVLVNKFVNTRFEPAGYTSNPDIRIVKSLVDYWFRWLDAQYGGGTVEAATEMEKPTGEKVTVIDMTGSFDGPLCTNCGSLTKRSGSCHVCPGCGSTTGCS